MIPDTCELPTFEELQKQMANDIDIDGYSVTLEGQREGEARRAELKFVSIPSQDLRLLKIWKVDFKPVYPIGGCLIIAAYSKEQASEIAAATLAHTTHFDVSEVFISGPGVIEYNSGDY